MADKLPPDSNDQNHPPLGMDFRSFFDSLAEGIIVYNAKGEIIDANLNAMESLGAHLDPTFGQRISALSLMAPEDGLPLDATQRPGAATFRTGKSISAEIVGTDIPGRGLRWFSLYARRLSIDGEPMGVVISFLDVTDKRKSELAVQMFMELSGYIVNASDEADLLQHMTDTVVKVGQYPLAWIGVASDAQRGIDVAHSAGDTDYLDDWRASSTALKAIELGPAGAALRTGTTQVVNGLATDPQFEPWAEGAARFGLVSCVAIPFNLARRKAVLTIYDRHARAFDEITVERITRITSEFVFGTAHVRSINQKKVAERVRVEAEAERVKAESEKKVAERVRVEAEAERVKAGVESGVAYVRSVRELAAALDGSITVMGRITEARDPYTAGHQVRVGLLGAAIGTQLGLKSELVELIRRSGWVHDIGKTAIPIELLTRPGKLDPLEFEIIKRHTTIGATILSEASLPWPIAQVALQHHERMNGSGYPSGLSGNEIILPARIIAVADVIEAMMNHRPYRPALGLDKALAEVRAGAGTLFDPDVVKACLALFEAGFTFEPSSAFVKV